MKNCYLLQTKYPEFLVKQNPKCYTVVYQGAKQSCNSVSHGIMIIKIFLNIGTTQTNRLFYNYRNEGW